jgi:hypothetical protein
MGGCLLRARQSEWLRSMRAGISVTVLAAVVASACEEPGSKQNNLSTTSAVQEITLSSGKIIRVADIRQRESAELGTTLTLEYFTEFKVDFAEKYHKALQHEVEEIWAEFRPDAEKAGARTVFIVPTDPNTHESISFALRRDKDGSWQKSGGFVYPSSKR